MHVGYEGTDPMSGLLARTAGALTRSGRLRLVAEIAGGVLLLSAGAAAASVATSGTAAPAIHGCVNTRTGALSVQLKAGARCPRGTKALSWSVTGPRGPAGTTAFGSKTNTAAEGGSAGATCTLGSALLMPGGYYPEGTIPANGRLLQISSDTPLYALYGTSYGGNGTSTFGIPNLKSAAPDGLTYVICNAGVYP
jgi:Phage Tail Collar Domain